MLPSQPITVLVVCIHTKYSYIYGELHVRQQRMQLCWIYGVTLMQEFKSAFTVCCTSSYHRYPHWISSYWKKMSGWIDIRVDVKLISTPMYAVLPSHTRPWFYSSIFSLLQQFIKHIRIHFVVSVWTADSHKRSTFLEMLPATSLPVELENLSSSPVPSNSTCQLHYSQLNYSVSRQSACLTEPWSWTSTSICLWNIVLSEVVTLFSFLGGLLDPLWGASDSLFYVSKDKRECLGSWNMKTLVYSLSYNNIVNHPPLSLDRCHIKPCCFHTCGFEDILVY